MSTFQIQIRPRPECLPVHSSQDVPQWYAVHTRARHEKRVAAQLEEKSIGTFLPLLRQIRPWSDRLTKVEVPMFSCYAFVHIVDTVEERLRVVQTHGVLGLVGGERRGTPIPEGQIESIRAVVRENVPCFPHPFLREGKRVRIRGGSLEGIEGIVLRHSEEQSLVISIELLQRSIRVRVEGYNVEPA